MRAIIGPNLLSSKVAQPTKKPFELYDSRLPGFTLRVQPSGVRSYYARFGRNRRITLGKADTLLPDEARERCQKVLGNVAHGRHPGSRPADHALLPTRSRSCIGTSEPGTQVVYVSAMNFSSVIPSVPPRATHRHHG